MIFSKRLKRNQEFKCSFMHADKSRSKLRFQKDIQIDSDFWILMLICFATCFLEWSRKWDKAYLFRSETLFENKWGYKWGGGHGFIVTLVCSAIRPSEICLLYAPNFYSAVEMWGIVLNQQRYLIFNGNCGGWYGQSCPAPIESMVQSKAGGVGLLSLQISSCVTK